jgi:hypothetical protein
MAAMLVLIIVALATMIAMAMLSSASLQASVSDNATRGAVADYMANSAIQAAAHYLQNPGKLPVSWVKSGYALYVTGATVSGVRGSFDVNATVNSTIPDAYVVTATGYSGSTNTVTRSATAQIQLQRAMPSYGTVFGSGSYSLIGAYTVNGGILVSGTVVSTLGATVNGGINSSPKSTDFTVPAVGSVNYFGAGTTTYKMSDGRTGTAQVLPSGTVTSQPAWNSTTNPGEVFYFSGPMTIGTSSGTLALGGTYIVRSNSLTVKNTAPGANSAVNVKITPVSGMPALIVDQNISLTTKNVGLTVNGVVWLGSQFSLNGGLINPPTVTINGSLLLPTSASLALILGGSATINYDATKTTVNSFNASTPEPIVGVKYLTGGSQ